MDHVSLLTASTFVQSPHPRPRPHPLCPPVQAGVKMEQVKTSLTLIYPQTAHDYEYYRASTVAWFMVAEVKAKLERVLGIVH